MQTLENTLGFKSQFSKILGVATLSLATLLGTAALPAHAADAELVVQAIKASASAPANSYVQATVTIATLGSAPQGSAANQPKSMVAQGKVIREASTNLTGILPLTFDAAYKPAPGIHSLNFKVTRSGRIGLQWLVNGNTLDELMMEMFDTNDSPQALTKQIVWHGAPRMVTVTFETKQARKIMPIIVGTIKLKEPIKIATPIKIVSEPQKPPFVVVGTVKLPKKATGRKVTIKARFVVTNSEDGVGGVWGSADTSVELYGSLKIGGQTAFSFNGSSARDGDEYTKTLDSVVLRYNDPEIHFTKVGGKIADQDKLSSSDTLFNASTNIDLLQIMASNKEFLIKGDRKSESGDLYIRVIDAGEVFD